MALAILDKYITICYGIISWGNILAIRQEAIFESLRAGRPSPTVSTRAVLSSKKLPDFIRSLVPKDNEEEKDIMKT